MEKLYYISQGATAEEHLQNIEKVCRAGVRLVQLRMKGYSDEEYSRTALQAVELVHRYGGKLIVNDNIKVAFVANADGVHLGQKDVSPLEARKLLRDKIIGGTANTATQCEKLLGEGVDYLGVGPFRFTTTKQNLSPILGIEGYKEILTALKGVKNVPLFAIGGITEEDIQPLLTVGVDGVAISGVLTQLTSESIKQLIEKII